MKHYVAAFGESVQFREATSTHDQNKLDGEWAEGYLAGVITRSSEYIIIQNQQIFKCPIIRRKVASDAYRPECLEDMRADVRVHQARSDDHQT